MLLLDDDIDEIELLINEFNKLKINDIDENGDVYSFVLKPVSYQPYGSYNISKMSDDIVIYSFPIYPQSYAPSGCSYYGVSRTSELYDYFK
jgi:hypothetical protein